MKFDVYGRFQVEVVREQDRWAGDVIRQLD